MPFLVFRWLVRMRELVAWSDGVEAVDRFDEALGELQQRGLV